MIKFKGSEVSPPASRHDPAPLKLRQSIKIRMLSSGQGLKHPPEISKYQVITENKTSSLKGHTPGAPVQWSPWPRGSVYV